LAYSNLLGSWAYKVLLLLMITCKKVQQTIKIPVTVGYFTSHCSISTRKCVKLTLSWCNCWICIVVVQRPGNLR
jgi:hypothetical protein